MTEEEFLARLDKLPDSQLLREEHVASWLDVSVSKLQKDRLKGGGLRFFKPGGAVRYRVGDIRQYLKRVDHGSTSEYTTANFVTHLELHGPRLPFFRVDGKLYNFFDSLSLDQDIGEIIWLDQREQREKGLE